VRLKNKLSFSEHNLRPHQVQGKNRFVNENAKNCCVAAQRAPAAKLPAPDGPGGGKFICLKITRGAEIDKNRVLIITELWVDFVELKFKPNSNSN
jgi:hypothetical protein